MLLSHTPKQPIARIDLGKLYTPVLLFEAPTGVRYVQQINGDRCDRDMIEGFMLVLASSTLHIFQPGWWRYNWPHTARTSPLPTWILDCIDRGLQSVCTAEVNLDVWSMEIDRTAYNREAWIHLKAIVRTDDDRIRRGYGKTTPYNAILTWQNSA